VSPHNRILFVVGGAALIASMTIGLIFAGTNAAVAQVQTDEARARGVQALGDRLLAAVHGQHETLDEYLLSSDPATLTRYRQAVANEADTADLIATGAGTLAGAGRSGLVDALARIDSGNDDWRATIADPAIAAVQSGSVVAVEAAIKKAVGEQESTETATSELVVEVDLLQADLAARSASIDGLRVSAAVLGVVIELLAAGLSLWFVRRYGLTVTRDSRRRARSSAERISIVASLRTLRTQQTAEGTAALIAEALERLPGIDVAGVLECTAEGLRALAIVGLPGFPIRTGETMPLDRSGYLLSRSEDGPWAERWVPPAEPTPYEEGLAIAGVRSQAYAPIRADGEIIGLIALATTDAGNAHHLVEELPAVGEFASVAQAILAPALLGRRVRTEKRRRIGALIASGAFRPVFQPVVDLAGGTTVGYEALTRFDDGSRPDLTFASALECGMGFDLEEATLEAAICEARHLPADAWLSLNVSPALLAQEHTLASLLADSPRPIVLEVTEHEAIEAYAPLREAMVRLGAGVRLAVDDAGAGVANFNHLVELRPDFVKIDIGLVRGVDADPSRRAVVVGLIHFAAEAGCQVIAEGIETPAERATITELGVTLGQGYLLARPAPAETWSVGEQRQQGPAAAALPGTPLAPSRTRRPASRTRAIAAGAPSNASGRLIAAPATRGGR
jgi:EAL domain-containing protein (putative c-di-GMP-specific phosphodiesterase class I)